MLNDQVLLVLEKKKYQKLSQKSYFGTILALLRLLKGLPHCVQTRHSITT